MNFSYILIGSTHGFIDDFIKQKEIILSVKPEFVLCESLENLSLDSKEQFKDILNKRIISDMTHFKEVENLIRLCSDEGINLIGIDFHNLGFDRTLQRKIKNQERLSLKEESELNRILSLRERKHLDIILEYTKRTNAPLVIILGSWHLREGSLIRTSLNNYKIIAPCDEKGRILLAPKSKKISYCEIISNGNQS